MEASRSIKEFFIVKKIKKEPDESSVYDEANENLDPEKYYYKEELDLEWDENDNNYCDKPSDDAFNEKSVEKSIEKTVEDNISSILQNKNSQSKEFDVSVENSNIKRTNISEEWVTQKYYYKEELNLDWDKKDNDYAKTTGEKSVEENQTHIPAKNEHDSVFKGSRSKKRIVKIENPDAEKECPRCKKRLKNQNTLAKHLFYCGKAPHLQCDSCTYKAKYKNALITHIMRNHLEQIQKLRKKKTTKKVKSLSNKIVKEQQQNEKYFRYCVNCNVKTDQPTLNNCNKCESGLLYQCKKCNDTLRNRVEFVRHMNNVCDPKGYYHCPACDYKSTTKAHVKTHLKGHLLPGLRVDTEVIKWKSVEGKNDSENLFTCPSCGKQFQRKASFASHTRFCVKSQGVNKPAAFYVENENIKNGRSSELSRYCTKCNDEVLSNKKRTSKCCGSSILFKCSKCNKTSEDHDSMKHHVKNVCFKIKCDLCDFEGSKVRVAAHRRHKHDFNSVECPKCKTVVKNRSLFYSHSYLCGKEPLKCDYCSFKSKKQHILKAHILQHHPKQSDNVNAAFSTLN